jgi:DNA-binding transcriptional ArsR family regulator
VNLLLKGLDDPTRRKIIELLKKRDMTAGEIADHFNMSKPSISHHLDLLKQAKVIVGVKEGQFITYSLNTTVFDELVKWILDVTKKHKT